MRKPVKVVAAVLLVSAAVTLAIALFGGQSAAAASKSVTCPDNTSGVKDAGWSVVCSGQSALKATITLSTDMSGYLDLAVKVPSTDAFVGANAAFDKKKATSQIILTSQSTGSQAYISITVTAPKGAAPGGVSVTKPSPGTAPAKFYRLIFRP